MANVVIKLRPFEFIGGSYTSINASLDAQRCINLYPETDESGQGKNRASLVGTPGISSFCTLPTAPVRGILATDASRLFVVAGSRYYEIQPDGSYTDRGDVGVDDGIPVVMIPNGVQVMIVSSGKVWIDDGLTVEQANYQNGEGTVTASGTAVTWISGSTFDDSNVGNAFVIGAASYTVASVTDSTHLVLTASAGSVPGTTVTGTVNATGTAVTRVSGTYFNPDYIAETTGPKVCTIGGTVYTIASVQDGSHMTLVAPGVPAPLTGAAFSVTYGVSYAASYPVEGHFGAFLDGYYIVAKYGSQQFNISAINDGTHWNPIDFAKKEGGPDGIVGLLADHEELWIFGKNTTEVWNDTGAASFPLQRNPSGFIPTGTSAIGSICRVGDKVGWLGSDSRGNFVAYLAAGFIPQRVSTYAVERDWAEMKTTEDCRSYSYFDDGHMFWVIGFPSGNKTWVYDATEHLWHERASWDATGGGGAGAYIMHRATTHGFLPALFTGGPSGTVTWGIHVVGDYFTGDLYVMGLDIYDDNGVPIHRQRAAPYIANNTHFTYFSEFILDIEQGTAGADIKLDFSEDAGITWSTPRTAYLYDSRLNWRRLGKSRARIFRLTYSGGGKVGWINAHVDAAPGIT